MGAIYSSCVSHSIETTTNAESITEENYLDDSAHDMVSISNQCTRTNGQYKQVYLHVGEKRASGSRSQSSLSMASRRLSCPSMNTRPRMSSSGQRFEWRAVGGKGDKPNYVTFKGERDSRLKCPMTLTAERDSLRKRFNYVQNHILTRETRATLQAHTDEFLRVHGCEPAYQHLREVADQILETPTSSCYKALTESMQQQNVCYVELARVRRAIVDGVCGVIKRLHPLDIHFDDYGSEAWGSDMDVAVKGRAAEGALMLVYGLGLISRGLGITAGVDQTKLEADNDVLVVIELGIQGIQRLFDIGVYSSSGVAHGTAAQVEGQTGINRHAIHVGDGVFQMLRRAYCAQHIFSYLVLAHFLFSRLVKKPVAGDEPLDFTSDVLSASERLQQWASTSSPLDRFVAQVGASSMATYFSDMLFDDSTETEIHYAYIVAKWEQYATLANAVSPGSAVAPPTFLDVVVCGQQGLQSHVNLDAQELYLSFLENFGNMQKRLQQQDWRPAYKYAMRTAQVYSLVAGKSTELVLDELSLSSREMETLRRPDREDCTDPWVDIQTKLHEAGRRFLLWECGARPPWMKNMQGLPS